MADRRIYAGYYQRYDGKLIYVVSMAKDADSGEDIVIWTPFTYSETHKYFTMSKKSFCEYVVVGGKRQAKFKRQTQMKIRDSSIEDYRAEGFRGPIRKESFRSKNEYDKWYQPSFSTYYQYAKNLCEQHSFLLRKYQLCMAEKDYIGISKEDFRSLKEDLIFLKHCLKTVLQDYESYFEERFVAGLSIRKYAQAHSLNRGSVDYLQKKVFTTLAHELKERDEAQGKKRIRTT